MTVRQTLLDSLPSRHYVYLLFCTNSAAQCRVKVVYKCPLTVLNVYLLLLLPSSNKKQMSSTSKSNFESTSENVLYEQFITVYKL